MLGIIAFLSCLVSLVVGQPYPVYNNMYGRGWTPLPMYAPRAGIPSPLSPYYDPYGQDFGEVLDFYYPVDPYEKYRLYQMPYYYTDLPSYNGYYGVDDGTTQVSDNDDDFQAKDEAPYGQETWYENGAPPKKQPDSNADTNAIFLQNLIMAQMYKDAAAKGYRYPITYSYPQVRDDYDDSYVYGEHISNPQIQEEIYKPKEDEDVKELKSLVGDKPRKHRRNNIFAEQRTTELRKKEPEPPRRRSWYQSNQWSPEIAKRQTTDTTLPTLTTTAPPKFDKGQEEVVLPRPATPVRQPSFHSHLSRAHQPSAYDSIKKLLHMQDQLEEEQRAEGSRFQKRSYTSSEESLVEQLGNLKKSA